MSPSIASTLAIIFIHSFFLLISTPTTASSSSLIEQACTLEKRYYGPKLCIQLLQSQPKVASAKNLFNLCVATIESGISKAANTSAYMESLLNANSTDPNLKSAVQGCKTAYKGVIGSFQSALSEIVEIKEYISASYDLLIGSVDSLQRCEYAMNSKKVKDKVISSGSDVVQIFGLTAFDVVNKLA